MITRKRLLFSLMGMTVVSGLAPVAWGWAERWNTSTRYIWRSIPVVYYVNPNNRDMGAAEALAEIQQAADNWSQQANTAFRFSYGGLTSTAAKVRDGRNVVFFSDNNSTCPSCGADTWSWYDSSNNLIEGDIEISDGPYTWLPTGAPCSGALYVQDMLTHEFGHMLGLGHSSFGSATMYTTISYCSTAMRSLDPDDIAGIETLYPHSGSTVTTTTIAATTSTTLPPTAGFWLSARGYKVKGMRRADLSWGGAYGGSVDLYRNGARITSTENDGFHTDPIGGKGGGSFSYQACESGTSTCSNSVDVTF